MGIAAVITPPFRVEINDPRDVVGWEAWHGFAKQRWTDGYDTLASATRAVRRLRSQRPAWGVRLLDPDDQEVVVP